MRRQLPQKGAFRDAWSRLVRTPYPIPCAQPPFGLRHSANAFHPVGKDAQSCRNDPAHRRHVQPRPGPDWFAGPETTHLRPSHLTRIGYVEADGRLPKATQHPTVAWCCTNRPSTHPRWLSPVRPGSTIWPEVRTHGRACPFPHGRCAAAGRQRHWRNARKPCGS